MMRGGYTMFMDCHYCKYINPAQIDVNIQSNLNPNKKKIYEKNVRTRALLVIQTYYRACYRYKYSQKDHAIEHRAQEYTHMHMYVLFMTKVAQQSSG